MLTKRACCANRIMGEDKLKEIACRIEDCAAAAVKVLAFAPDWTGDLPRQLDTLQSEKDRLFDALRSFTEETEFWENAWRYPWMVREMWEKIRRAALKRSHAAAGMVEKVAQSSCAEIYRETTRLISEYAPRKPDKELLHFGIECCRPDCTELHERIEGLYESIKRQNQFPVVKHDLEPAAKNGVNFGIIYGGGWNVSSYSVLDAAEELEDVNAMVAFDYPGRSLFGKKDRHTVRLAHSALVRNRDGKYILASFHTPQILHFVCPHEWTGEAPHDIGVPALRSELIVNLVSYKHLTSQALAEYQDESGFRFNLIDEEFVPTPAELPADPDSIARTTEDAVNRLASRDVREIVVKPSRGEEARDVEMFKIPEKKQEAVCHCIKLALDSGALIQERIIPRGARDYNWRVFVAQDTDGRPRTAGSFARIGRGDSTEMVAEHDMLKRAGITGKAGSLLLQKMDEAALHAFKAITLRAARNSQNFPDKPLGGVGNYSTPYFLGIDLIGNARVMEINGNEVAGMWTDDRLYPEQKGRTSRTMLRSARQAALAYKQALRYP